MAGFRIVAIATALAMTSGLAATTLPASEARAQVSVSINVFYERLAPHGAWVRHNRYGWVWYPTSVDRSWRPYVKGHWTWTDQYGWLWVSNEPWGWATYHYGRWYFDDEHGWVWVPGYEWGPSWVAWRYGPDYIGWAPLPPDAEFVGDAQLRWGRVDLSAEAYRPYWVFVPGRRFTSRQLTSVMIAPERNQRIFASTRTVVRFERRGQAIANRGVVPAEITRRFGGQVPRVRVETVNRPQAARVQNNVVNIYRPTVKRDRAARPPERSDRRPPPTRDQFRALRRPGADTDRQRDRTRQPGDDTDQQRNRTRRPGSDDDPRGNRTRQPDHDNDQRRNRSRRPGDDDQRRNRSRRPDDRDRPDARPRTRQPDRDTDRRREQPRTGQPRTGQPRTDQPRTDQPRTDQPRTVEPRTGPRDQPDRPAQRPRTRRPDASPDATPRTRRPSPPSGRETPTRERHQGGPRRDRVPGDAGTPPEKRGRSQPQREDRRDGERKKREER